MKARSRARSRAPAFTLGHVALWAASVGLGAFGVAGWVASGGSLAAQVLLGAAAGLSACVIPATVHHVGKGAISALLLLAVAPFAVIAAYSTHHAVEVLIEEPRREAFTAEAAAAVRTWAQRVETAEGNLAAHAPLTLAPDMPAGRVRDQNKAWADAHAALKQARDEAKAGHAEAVAARDERVQAYRPMASDEAVWLVAGSIDLAIVIGIAVLSAITRQAEPLPKRKPNKTRKAKATAPRGVPNWKPRVVQAPTP